ncbi:hypothetical protein JNUCC1_03370 [Lentibacillus sp. JNUCC-1]|uniref:hypothetical protein n=1 Tax=Lentibacillus sp. JNUCC-1 TaxID=2654513 RepID=UPI0012E86B51|nr:hypothetical protein [Lentibacillus sp. JNUCC-1]MUV39492.1 hypothetical protein [Lentibacillus sp. JNUCC-1]
MEKILPGHLVGFGSAREMDELENYYEDGFTDAGLSEIRFKDKLTGAECEKLCADLSSEVIVYNMNK